MTTSLCMIFQDSTMFLIPSELESGVLTQEKSTFCLGRLRGKFDIRKRLFFFRFLFEYNIWFLHFDLILHFLLFFFLFFLFLPLFINLFLKQKLSRFFVFSITVVLITNFHRILLYLIKGYSLILIRIVQPQQWISVHSQSLL